MLITIYIFIFWLVFWSFLNAWLYRIREEISLKWPSKCPNCNNNIKWFDNIPVFGWLFLKGKCRNCKQSISIQYPLVELLTWMSFLLSYYILSTHWTFLNISSLVSYLTPIDLFLNINFSYYFIIFLILAFTYFFVAVSIYDFKYKEIPNEFVAILWIISIPFLIANPWNILAWIIGLTFFVLQYLIVMKLYKVEWVWMWDAKLALVLGFILGKLLLPAMFIAYFSAVIYSFFYYLYTKFANKEFDREIPFGPFIYFWAFISIYFVIYPFNSLLF